MPEQNATRVPAAGDPRAAIDWTNPDAVAIDGFTVAQVVRMIVDSLIPARCSECEAEHRVEADAENYDCESCGAKSSVTSPLVKLGFV